MIGQTMTRMAAIVGNFESVSRNASRQVGNYVQYMSLCIFYFFCKIYFVCIDFALCDLVLDVVTVFHI